MHGQAEAHMQLNRWQQKGKHTLFIIQITNHRNILYFDHFYQVIPFTI
jgi:hypothetical protein